MPTAEELERSGVIAVIEAEQTDTGRITFQDEDWNGFRRKVDILQTNHAKAQVPVGLYGPLRREFMKVVGLEVSNSFIQSVTKLEYKPSYRGKNSPGFKFVAWILNLPSDYVVSVDMMRHPMRHHVQARAVPSPEAKREVTAFESFIDEHADEIQAPLINAWKQITSFYNVEVVLASLRRMGFNDAAIAALSRAAAK